MIKNIGLVVVFFIVSGCFNAGKSKNNNTHNADMNQFRDEAVTAEMNSTVLKKETGDLCSDDNCPGNVK
jgi:hypothetical protein